MKWTMHHAKGGKPPSTLAVTVTEAVIHDGFDARIVRLRVAATLMPHDTLETSVNGVAFYSVPEANGMVKLDAQGRIEMYRGGGPPVTVSLPDRSDPAAVERWLASDEEPAP